MNTVLPVLIPAEPIEREDDCRAAERALVLAYDEQLAEFENDCRSHDRGKLFDDGRALTGVAYAQAPATHCADLPNGFHLAFSPYAPAGPSVLNPAAWARWQAFARPRPVTEAIDQALASQNLILPAGRSPTVKRQPAETLTAWLHITNACNLDCPYCYVRKSSARMSEAVGRAALAAVFRSAQAGGFKRVKLKYAGGEATLHFQLVRRLHELAQAWASDTGLELQAVVLSNGVQLRSDDAEWLARQAVKLVISLDGVGAAHDRLRFQHRGEATFARVADTIERQLLPRGIRPDITMTVTGQNAPDAAKVARWALLERSLPVNFSFYRANLLSAARPDLALEEAAIIEGMAAAYDTIERDLPTRPFFNGLLDRIQAEAHVHTCGVGQSYVVITHTGAVAQCQMHLEQPVGPMAAPDLIPLIAAGPLHNMAVDQKSGCRECVYRHVCSGGCPVETYRATGRWDVQSPNCRIYKSLLPKALRLEALRLMKVHGYLG